MYKKYIGAIGLAGESVFLTVERFHKPGETIIADSIHVEPGGKAYNQIVEASRLGAKGKFFAAMGNDKYKDTCVEYLKNENVESYIEIIENKNTPFATIITDKNGDNQITVVKGAAEDISIDFILKNENEIAKCKILILSLEIPLEIVVKALEIAEKYQIYTILNPAPATKINFDILKRFDLITPNFSEIQVLLGKDFNSLEGLVAALRASCLTKAIVTLGSDGALLYENSMFYHYKGLKVNAVDTTGAGDTFTGALSYMIFMDNNLNDAIEFAINASAESVKHRYAVDSLPTIDEIRKNYIKVIPKIIK